jgi:hypothetical protein
MGTLRRLDSRLQELFDAWGGVERVLQDACVMLTADHSHSDVMGNSRADIVLDDVLAGLQCAAPGDGWSDGDDLMLCPNMRAAEVYLREKPVESGGEIRRVLMADPRIDQVIWREPEPRGRFHVETTDRGVLRFRQASADGVKDPFGARWTLEGDLEALDLSLDGDRLEYGCYPNALERIAHGVDDRHPGRFWLTARVGYEFQVPGQQVHHGAGSHGSLHALDSVVPLLVAGDPEDRPLPRLPRIVDAVPLAARIVGVPFRADAGETRGDL